MNAKNARRFNVIISGASYVLMFFAICCMIASAKGLKEDREKKRHDPNQIKILVTATEKHSRDGMLSFTTLDTVLQYEITNEGSEEADYIEVYTYIEDAKGQTLYEMSTSFGTKMGASGALNLGPKSKTTRMVTFQSRNPEDPLYWTYNQSLSEYRVGHVVQEVLWADGYLVSQNRYADRQYQNDAAPAPDTEPSSDAYVNNQTQADAPTEQVTFTTEPDMTETTKAMPETQATEPVITQPSVYRLLFDANGGQVNESAREVTEGAVIGKLPTPTRLGYSFDGWFTSAAGGTRVNEQMTMAQGNVPLYAHWTALNDLRGTKVVFGKYEQDNNLSNGPEDIIWEVFTYNNDVVWVVSEWILDAKPYNNKAGNVNWPSCSLRYWLKDDFLHGAFTPEEQSYLVRLDVDGDYNPANAKVYPGDTVDDYVAIFSYHELKKYYPSYGQVQCQGTAYAKANGLTENALGFSSYWTRTPGVEANLAVIARSTGDFNEDGREVEQSGFGVRPLLCIKRSAFR